MHSDMRKLEHLGIAVKSLDDASVLFSKMLNTCPYKIEEVESEGVRTMFFSVGDTKIELLEGTGHDNVISKFIEKRGEGIHHLAFEVDDIFAEAERLKNEGFILLNDKPKIGADNKLIMFLHPKTTNGVLIEICQERK